MSQLSRYTPLLNAKSVELKRQEIQEYFHNTYELFERVFELLKDERVWYKKSEPTRHPMIFYYGHTATFFINKLLSMNIIEKRINPEFESIFAVGVDEMSWDDLESSRYEWPAVRDVRAYREEVKRVVDAVISKMAFTLPIEWESPMWVILMGIEHERIHIETSLVLHRQMPLKYVKESKYFPRCRESGDAPQNEMVHIEGKRVSLGANADHRLYGWDNEYGHYEERVEDFALSKYLVSNGEFLEFVQENGYERLEYWDDEGREFLEKSGAKMPHFWSKEGDVYKYRTLSELIDMPYNWPVDVNALEAEAFCRYKSQKDGITYQLPSEAEYRVLLERSKIEDIPAFDAHRANLNFSHYASSVPVDSFEFDGIYDVVGNVWQWSRSLMRAFEGFRVHEAYDDFTLPTFDAKHALILGSSWASSGNLITKHARYAFRKHFFQNAGFRYVITEKKEESLEDIYESDALVSQYCEFQYGKTHFGVENFAVTTAAIASSFAKNKRKALDLGCATGRASFELAREFDAVEGIDFSVRFVQVGSKLKEEGYVAFSSVEEGDLTLSKKVTLEDLGYEKLREKVSFWQGDACNLKPNFQGYDLIMATNLIDRLYNPQLFLESVGERLNKEGILVLTSPYTWQKSSTKRELWLGGYRDENGNEVRTIDTLTQLLSAEFERVHLQDVEFVIKETARKYQHTISELSVWKKR